MGNTQEFGQGERALTRAAEMVSQARGDLNGFVSQLDNQIAGIQGQWGGAGARAFQILHAAWTEKQTMINNALDRFAEALTATEHDNTVTDETQGSNFSQMVSQIEGSPNAPTL